MPIKTTNIDSSGNNEYETPPEIFSHWNGIFDFHLDVCASAANNKLPEFFTKEDNCLKQEWRRRNWMNPPYGKPEYACGKNCKKKKCKERGYCITEDIPGLSDFVKKAFGESLKGKLVVALIPVSTATEWWQSYVAKADHIFYYPHRINFLLNGEVVKGCGFDPCIVIWGLHPNED